MDYSDFRFRDSFTGISAQDMQLALDEVEVVWSGIRTLWGKLPTDLKLSKQELCMQFLSAWYLADLNPKAVTKGLFNSGGVLITNKSIDGISVSYKQRNLPPNLEQLASNAFGLKALDMILGAPDRLLIHG